jgi:uncharacterized protein YggU (UPF0235/DUF167 family)
LSYLRETADGVIVSVRAVPNARKTEIVANEELCTFLAHKLSLPKSAVSLRSGATSRSKTVLVKGLSLRLVRGYLVPISETSR